MKKDDIMYGLDGQELLDGSVEEVIERVFDDNFSVVGESFDDTADRIEWPIKILTFKRVELDETAIKGIADSVLENTLESLDCDHGNPDECFDPTDNMKTSAEAFAKVVVDEYVSWACVPTGDVREVSREEAKREDTQ